MLIGGFQKLSFIDFPDTIASVVFTQGCNWRCPWCHNPSLVYPEKFESPISEKDVVSYLKSRVGKIEGVVVSGGEPTLQPSLFEFFKTIKSLGLATKLDTNGSNPEILRNLITQSVLDFVAMDIKSGEDNYSKLVGCKVDLDKIRMSMHLIRSSGIPFQFRTTVVPSLHKSDDPLGMKQFLRNQESVVLQKQQNCAWDRQAIQIWSDFRKSFLTQK